MKLLLVFSGLAHDPQSILAAVHRLALVGIELTLHIGFGVGLGGLAGMKLGVAAFTDTKGNGRSFYDSQFAFLHDCSLAHLAGKA